MTLSVYEDKSEEERADVLIKEAHEFKLLAKFFPGFSLRALAKANPGGEADSTQELFKQIGELCLQLSESLEGLEDGQNSEVSDEDDLDGEDELRFDVNLPCPICRTQIENSESFDGDTGLIGRQLNSFLRLKCEGCGEVYFFKMNMVAEDDADELPYDPMEYED